MLGPIMDNTLQDRGWWRGHNDYQNAWLIASPVGDFRGNWNSKHAYEAGSIDPAWPVLTVPHVLRIHVVNAYETEHTFDFQLIIRDDSGFLFQAESMQPGDRARKVPLFGLFACMEVGKALNNPKMFWDGADVLATAIWRRFREDLLNILKSQTEAPCNST